MSDITPRTIYEDEARRRLAKLAANASQSVNQRLLDLLKHYPMEEQVVWMSNPVRIAGTTSGHHRRYELPFKVLINELEEKGGIHDEPTS